MSYNELVAMVEVLQERLGETLATAEPLTSTHTNIRMAKSIADYIMRRVGESRAAEAEAAMCAEWEMRQDAMADALSAGWGHD